MKKLKAKGIKLKAVMCCLIVVFAAIPFAATKAAEVVVTKSPDGHIAFGITVSGEGQLRYSLSANGNSLLASSQLGLDFGNAGSMPAVGWTAIASREHKVNKVWKPVWGKRSVVPDRYNETIITLRGTNAPFNMLRIAVRAYNDGVAFRYEIPSDATGDSAMSERELTTFAFAGDYTAWFYNGEHHNLGPDKLTEVNGNRLPVMTIKAGDDAYMALHEADLRSGSPMVLNSKKGTTVFSVASSPGLIRPGYVSAWRVIFYGKTPGAMVDSHLLELLNPAPPAGMDFSWVKPGVALWDRRIGGARGDSFVYEWSSYPSWVRLVDFAAAKGIPYLAIDSKWYGEQFSKDADPVKGGKVNEVKQLIAYAKTKGVRIWLYMNDIAGRNYPLDQTLKQYHDWGVAGIKYGFMRDAPEKKNTRTRMITALCAKYHLLCDFHDGPVHPYGQMRTYPNAVTREYCKAQLDAHSFFEPKTFVTTVFVNMLAGPLDMTNGIFDLLHSRTDHIYKPELPSTVASEAARTLITFSGVTMIPDIPENYNKYPELFSFIAAEKMPWAESKTLLGEIGEYIVMARKASDGTWLVGAANNESARECNIPLSFLGKGNYEATIIQDGDNADYRTNRTAYKVDKRLVRATDIIQVKLAAGGGACLMLKKK